MEQLRAKLSYIVFTLVVVGVGLFIYGGYTYFSASQKISDIEEQRQQTQELLQGTANPRELAPGPMVLSDIELRKQRNEQVDRQQSARLQAGVGIVLIAVGWLLHNITQSRRAVSEP